MEATIRSYEKKLIGLIDGEFVKGADALDDKLILACSDGLLRLGSLEPYILTAEQFRRNKAAILDGTPVRTRRSRRAVKILLAAAIIAALLLGIIASGSGHEQMKYEIIRYPTDSAVFFYYKRTHRHCDALEVGYVPEGFELINEIDEKFEKEKDYSNGELSFNITKSNQTQRIWFDVEHKKETIVQIGNTDYIITGEDDYTGVFWGDNNRVYMVCGDLSNAEALKIAQSVR